MAQQNQWISRITNRCGRLARDTRGNTYFMVAAAMLPMIGIVGSGVDVGRAYMADLRLQQACDAGVLAGRRTMTGGTYTAAHEVQANKMFNFNFQPGTYGSTTIAFDSWQDGPSNVRGTATAVLPTALMQVFGQNQFNLSVNCTARLEISNVDVMLVLDVTGSMSSTNSGDTVNRITALKNATMNFFDTLTSAAVGDGRIRFGVVPYDTNINVGAILAAENPNWLTDEVTLPSRTPVYTTTWGTGETTYGTPFDGTPWQHADWSNNGGSITGKNSTTCPETTPPAPSAPTSRNNRTTVQTGQYVDANGNQVTTFDTTETFEYFEYRYAWRSSQCRQQRRTLRYVRTTPSTVTQPPVPVFSRYRYEDRIFNVVAAKTGGTVTADVGDSGSDLTASWGGCIIERQTAPFAANTTAPSSALDMDIDMVPTADPNTQWQPQLRDMSFTRNGETADLTTSDRNAWGEASCPQAVMKLTTYTTADRATFNSYIQALAPGGNTYHDFGMVWGARLLSPTGIFAGDNTVAPNGRPIQRHIIFMTDGDMFTSRGNLGLQGHEPTMQRVGQSSDSDGTARHNNRFLQLCASAKSKNMTIWTIDFDSSLTGTLVTCASGSDKAFLAANAAQLNTQFQAIARQIARLRIQE